MDVRHFLLNSVPFMTVGGHGFLLKASWVWRMELNRKWHAPNLVLLFIGKSGVDKDKPTGILRVSHKWLDTKVVNFTRSGQLFVPGSERVKWTGWTGQTGQKAIV